MGHLFEMRFVNLNLSYSLWTLSTIPTILLRILISILLYVICAIPFFFVSDDQPESQIYYLWAVKFFMPCFSYAFLMFAFGRVLFYKMNLVNNQSVGKMFELNEDDENNFTSSGTNKLASNSVEFQEMEMAQRKF